ncbi:MAG: thermonuclease family protein [Bacillota bacterium]
MKKLVLFGVLILITTLLTACNNDSENEDSKALDTELTDSLTLEADYEGKSFFEDGIGEVIITRCVDGDTFHFREVGSDVVDSVRFIGVDTPETNYGVEPWGQAASDFTCIKLANAETIVLEWDDSLDSRTGNYGRWLGFVWYDGRLLNLELVELAYSHSSAINTKYGDIMQDAWYKAMATGRRVHGEIDEDYDYD